MTAQSATAARTRTGGPQDDGPSVVEHIAGSVCCDLAHPSAVT